MITVIVAPASSTARGLAPPSSPATTDGSPNTPLPRMLLIASATMLQRPSARTSCGCAPRRGWVVTAPLYHKPSGHAGVIGAPRRRAVHKEFGVRYSYATHLECSLTGERYDITRLQGLSAAKKPLLARYDLEALRRELPREAIEARAAGASERAHREPRRGRDATHPAAAQRPPAWLPARHRQGRGPPADRLIQGARAVSGGVDGTPARCAPRRHPHQRQCRRRHGRLCRPGGHGGGVLLPRRHPRGQPERDRAPGRGGLSRQRPHQ